MCHVLYLRLAQLTVPHLHHPFCSLYMLHLTAVLLPWDAMHWMDRADCADLWSAGPLHLPHNVSGLQTTTVTCVGCPRGSLFQKSLVNRDIGEPKCPHYTCYMCIYLSWCHALGTCSNLEGFVSGRGGNWEVDCWYVCQTHCNTNKFDARKQFVWFYHNIFHGAELVKI